MTGFNTTKNYDKENFTNLVALAPYYGNQPPAYYTQQDKEDIKNIGAGIPRYALITAKYAKHIMHESGATKLNIISVSMGSLVTRYLIEKDLAHLSSEKKISKWLSLEGVIKGNIAASSRNLLNTVNTFDKQSPDVAHMKYTWIRENLNESHPNYQDIQIGFESSTNDDAHNGLLSWWMIFNDNFEANDGVQAVKDTFFTGDYAHTFYHDNHYSLADNKSAWAYAATFLISKKRVRLTLLDTSLKANSVRFESRIFSLKAQEKYSITRAIGERVFDGAYLPYHDNFNTVIFDSYILEDETELGLELTPENFKSLRTNISIKEGIYPLQNSEWSGRVKVEVF